MKSVRFIHETGVRCAFVSTNSITQGEQVYPLWSQIIEKYGAHIDFAHHTFKWSSEASMNAQVHCVIIGFSTSIIDKPKVIYTNGRAQNVNNINAYLIEAPNALILSRNHPICNVPEIVTGNQATDDGNFFFSEDEYSNCILNAPESKRFFRKAYNSQGFINNKPMHCLWLVGISPAEIRKVPEVLQRIENIRKFRLASPKEATRRQANIPTLFTEIRQPKGNYIVIPKVSSENRRYIPLGFLPPDVICNNTIKFVPDATLYHFGILCSNVHNAWMRVVSGRMKSDYQYSNNIVYNNFPWPTPTDDQRAKIERTAQAILDARAMYPDSSLADLYDELTMPPELRKAHQENDKAVMQAYGFSVKDMTESACVAELMRMYQKLTEKEK